MTELVLEERCGATAWLRLNRPGAMNALNRSLASAIASATRRAALDPTVRVLVLTGSGTAFCAGVDLKELLGDLASPPAHRPDLLDLATEAFAAVRACRKPVVAALNGVAVAGGLELAMCCDVIFAAESARVGDGHAKFGMLPGGGGAVVLTRKIGVSRAKALLFSGETLPSRVLAEWGLIHSVVPDAALDDAVGAYASELADKSPLVLSSLKATAESAADASQSTSLQAELLALRDHMRSEDFREGLRSFQEKRRPQFLGR